MATAKFSKFAGILSVALSQHHLLGFEIGYLEFHTFLKKNVIGCSDGKIAAVYFIMRKDGYGVTGRKVIRMDMHSLGFSGEIELIGYLYYVILYWIAYIIGYYIELGKMQ